MNHTSDLGKPTVGTISHQGDRGHANDDSCDFFAVDCGFPVHSGPLSQTIYVGVIADGVSATQNGTQASRIATATIRAQLQGGPGRNETLSEWLESSVEQANDEILYEARRTPELENMSTTIVVAALAGPKLYVMHLGDSRAYLLRGDQIFRLTADHTWTEEAMAAGTITAEEAISHPARNQLQRFLGTKTMVRVDRGVIEPTTQLREEYLFLKPADTILICTDGVHGRVSESNIQDVVRSNAGYPQDGVEELVATALNAGERDDITAVLLELPPEKKSVPTGIVPPNEATNGLAAATSSTSTHSQVAGQSTGQPRSRRVPRAVLGIALLAVLLILTGYYLGYI